MQPSRARVRTHQSLPTRLVLVGVLVAALGVLTSLDAPPAEAQEPEIVGCDYDEGQPDSVCGQCPKGGERNIPPPAENAADRPPLFLYYSRYQSTTSPTSVLPADFSSSDGEAVLGINKRAIDACRDVDGNRIWRNRGGKVGWVISPQEFDIRYNKYGIDGFKSLFHRGVGYIIIDEIKPGTYTDPVDPNFPDFTVENFYEELRLTLRELDTHPFYRDRFIIYFEMYRDRGDSPPKGFVPERKLNQVKPFVQLCIKYCRSAALEVYLLGDEVVDNDGYRIGSGSSNPLRPLSSVNVAVRKNACTTWTSAACKASFITVLGVQEINLATGGYTYCKKAPSPRPNKAAIGGALRAQMAFIHSDAYTSYQIANGIGFYKLEGIADRASHSTCLRYILANWGDRPELSDVILSADGGSALVPGVGLAPTNPTNPAAPVQPPPRPAVPLVPAPIAPSWLSGHDGPSYLEANEALDEAVYQDVAIATPANGSVAASAWVRAKDGDANGALCAGWSDDDWNCAWYEVGEDFELVQVIAEPDVARSSVRISIYPNEGTTLFDTVAAAPNNYLANASFEHDHAGWQIDDGAGVTNKVHYAIDGLAHDGGRFLATNASGGGGLFHDVSINTGANESVVASAWMRSQEHSAQGSLCAGFSTDDWNCTWYDVGPEYELVQVVAEPDVAHASVRININPQGGTTFFDTVSVAPGGSVASASFEEGFSGWAINQGSGITNIKRFNIADRSHDGTFFFGTNSNGGGGVYQNVSIGGPYGKSIVASAWMSSQELSATGEFCASWASRTNCVPYDVGRDHEFVQVTLDDGPTFSGGPTVRIDVKPDVGTTLFDSVVVTLNDGVRNGSLENHSDGWHRLADPASGYLAIDRYDPSEAPPVDPFSCSVDEGAVSWTDVGQSKYWVYRSTDGGGGYGWLGRTLGAASFVDPAPVVGAKYQVHFAGIPRVECSVVAEPEAGGSFSCSVDEGAVSWTDVGQSKYWVYRSTNGGRTFEWLGRTLGETSLRTPYIAGALYQVHYAGIPRVECT